MDDLKYQIDYLTAINEKLVDSDTMYRFIAESGGQLYLYQDIHKGGDVMMIGPWDRYTGENISKDPFNEEKMKGFIYPADLDEFTDNIWNMSDKKRSVETMRIRSKNKKYYFDVMGLIKFDTGSNPIRRVIIFSDVTEYESRLEKLERLAYYDPVTDLCNGHFFSERLKELIRQADKNNEAAELLLIDMDDLKGSVSELFLIHENELIKDLAMILKKYENKYTFLGHIKKGLFGFAILDPNRDNCGVSIYEMIRAELEKPIALSSGSNYKLNIFGGIASYPEYAHSADELLFITELSLMNARKSGEYSLNIYSSEIVEGYEDERKIDKIIRDALENDRFELYYQPQYYSKDGRIRGAEALLRLFDDNKRVILEPDDIIKKCEDSGLIKEVGDQIIDKAIKTYAEWRDRYGYDRMLTINISAMQIGSDDLINTLSRYVYDYDLDPSMIELECREEAFINNINLSVSRLFTIKKMGFKVCLDNYGIGYSPLAYLKDIPVNSLKFDRFFIKQAKSDEATFTIASAIRDIALAFNIELIAEGIENSALLDIAGKLRCNAIQGYLLSKPIKPKEFEKLFMRESLNEESDGRGE
ncbi:MAG: bifunctional diguanylate cyclase/phosphodiesterase [Lachnospiraceae bacterium]|nr:bifunctional diguanylate cyclase/phosphodiesterase [Lachnospiraceae bacterium]